MVTVDDTVYALSRTLDDTRLPLGLHGRYYAGTQPLAFIAPADVDALKGRLFQLPVNLCRLAVDVLADRLRVEGFNTGRGTPRDLELWRLWKRTGMVEGSDQVTRAALIYGRAPVSVWSTIRPEDPRQTVVAYDPGTGERVSAFKRWQAGGWGHAVLYGPDLIRRLRTASGVPAGAELPSQGWTVVETIANPLGVVPVIDLVNRPSVVSTLGVSEMTDLEPLVDAICKLATDMLVSAEFGARPRRYTLGVEIREDELGNPVNPFVDGPSRVWQLEGDRQTAQIGQLDAASLSPYAEAIGALVHQVAALSQMPPSMVGIAMNQPASAEALRAAEAGLAARARARQRAFTGPWSEVIRLAAEATDGRPRPDLADVEPVWSDPETPTVAQAADAATKLVQSGVITVDRALDDLGYTPEEREAERQARRRQALDTAGLDLGGLLGGAA